MPVVAHVHSSSIFYHRIPLLSVTTSPRREKGFSCYDTGPFGSGRPATKAPSFPGTACHVTTQCHLCQLTILQDKRDLVARPIQPDDVQRIVAHTAFTKAEDTLSSSDQALPSLSPQTRDVTPITVSSFTRNFVQGNERTLLKGH